MLAGGQFIKLLTLGTVVSWSMMDENADLIESNIVNKYLCKPMHDTCFFNTPFSSLRIFFY